MTPATWLVTQQPTYLPARTSRKKEYLYGSAEVFESLRQAEVFYQNEKHPRSSSLEKVELPAGVRLTEHPRYDNCVLVMGPDEQQIAHAYYNKGTWTLYSADSTSSPLYVFAAADKLAIKVEKIGETVASHSTEAARKIGDLLRTLDKS